MTWQAIGTTASSCVSTDSYHFSSQANAAPTYRLDGTRVSATGSFRVINHNPGIAKSVDGSGNLLTISDFASAWTGFDTDGLPREVPNDDNNGVQDETVSSTLGSTARYQGLDNDGLPVPNQTLGVSMGRAGATFAGWANSSQESNLSTVYHVR